MSRYKPDGDRDDAGAATEIIPSRDGRGTSWETQPEDDTPPRLRVQAIERTAIVRFVDSEILFEEAAVRVVSQQLHRLIRENGHTRLVVNFAGVHHVSSDILAVLAASQREVERKRGKITLCGLAPLLQDTVRIAHLDRVFDIVSDEAEALGLVAR
jgi:anti-anti-sigma factor